MSKPTAPHRAPSPSQTTTRFTPVSTRALKDAAWIEYRVTRQISTGNGAMWIAQPFIPGWFVHEELGYATGEPHNLGLTMRGLTAQTRHAHVQLVANEIAEKRKMRATEGAEQKQKRETARERRLSQRRTAKRAGLRVVAGEYVAAGQQASG